MPFVEGSSNRIVKQTDGLWHCVDCDYANARYQPVVGHLGKHTTNKKRIGGPGRPKKDRDPLNMTLSQIVDQLDELIKENNSLRVALHKEKQRNVKIREALSAFMQA